MFISMMASNSVTRVNIGKYLKICHSMSTSGSTVMGKWSLRDAWEEQKTREIGALSQSFDTIS